ncbi:MAG: hypothetical protein ABIP50_03200 [Candidatus Saccharimonadales bacterium]
MTGPVHTEADFEHPHVNQSPYFQLDTDLMVLSEIAPRGDALSYGATPLDRHLTRSDQKHVQGSLRMLTMSIPHDTPLSIANFIRDTFDVRFDSRSQANDDNFMTALRLDIIPILEPKIQIMVERGRLGLASPAELILIRDLLGIRSAELACLTHPYGEHEESLAEMHKAVAYAVRLVGGEMHGTPETRFRIKESVGEDGLTQSNDDPKNPAGVLMTRKRTIASLPDGSSVRERSSFVLRMDAKSRFYTQFGDKGVAEMRAIQLLESDEQEAALLPFETFISTLASSKKQKNAISLSTTIYAYNPATTELVRKQEAERTEPHPRISRHYYFSVEDHEREVEWRKTAPALLSDLSMHNQVANAMLNPDKLHPDDVQAILDKMGYGHNKKKSPLRRLLSKVIKRP